MPDLDPCTASATPSEPPAGRDYRRWAAQLYSIGRLSALSEFSAWVCSGLLACTGQSVHGTRTGSMMHQQQAALSAQLQPQSLAGLHCLSKACQVCLGACSSSSIISSSPSSFAEELASMATKRQITDARPSARDQGAEMGTDDQHTLKRRLSLSVTGEPGWPKISQHGIAQGHTLEVAGISWKAAGHGNSGSMLGVVVSAAACV